MIPTTAGSSITVSFSAGLAIANVAPNELVKIPVDALSSVSVTGVAVVGPFATGVYATDAAGNLKALLLFGSGGNGVFFSSCGPFIVQDGNGSSRKRTLTTAQTTGLGGALPSTGSAFGDPHLKGLFGIKFDVFGEPRANYSLIVAPAFEINMQLADRGPEMRFMKQLSVLYRGKAFVVTPWTVKAKRAALVAHFESLGALVTVDSTRWSISIELCAQHSIVFTSHHVGHLSYLNFQVHVPGCHDAYGGLLGQIFRC